MSAVPNGPKNAPWEAVPFGAGFRVRRIVDGNVEYRQSASGRITDYKTQAAAKREAKAMRDLNDHLDGWL